MRVASLLSIAALVFAGGIPRLAGQTTDRQTVFTAKQAEAGAQEIRRNAFGACTDCHTTALTGRRGDEGELPPLTSLRADYQDLVNGNGGRVPAFVGAQFQTRWAARSTKDLITEFKGRFESSGLGEETRLNMIAYILQANGARPGAKPLTMATDVEIRSVIPAEPVLSALLSQE